MGALQMLVTVPKKKRRRAVDLANARRRIPEAYRINRRRSKGFGVFLSRYPHSAARFHLS